MDNEGKIKQEEWEVGFLFKHLGVLTPTKGESPDFTFEYEGTLVGLEHTRCFPNNKTIDNNSWRKIERKIEEELNKSDLPPRFFLYCAITHNEGKKNYKTIAEEILNGYRYMLDNGIYDIGAMGHQEYYLDKLTYLSYYPSYTPNHFIISEITGGFESKADVMPLSETVRKKEEKLLEYKSIEQNSAIQEYWLTVYIPPDENCTIEEEASFFNDSQYDRIYLINGRYIGALMQGDTSSKLRLK